MSGPVPSPGLAATRPYEPVRRGPACDLDLAGTEAGGLPLAGVELPAGALDAAARYPNAAPLAARIATALGVDASRVLVTAGADDALDRVARAVLAPGRNAIVTDPTFEMIPRYITLSGAELREVSWPGGRFPVDAVLARADARTAMVAIVSPNNPTGAVAAFDDVRRVHDALPRAVVILDLAYVEFADADPTTEALGLPRVVVVRTLSKAYGCPGLRVGYAAGSSEFIGWMRRAGGPFPVSSMSLAIAEGVLANAGPARDATVAATRAGRRRIAATLGELGAEALPSEANFVTVAGTRAAWIRDALAAQGIATRFFAGNTPRTRITIPVLPAALERLDRSLRTALGPQALLFDLDGVLADVSGSYREAIRLTAAQFGVTLTPEAIGARKAAGNANDDWALTTELVAAGGGIATLADVTRTFERLYQGERGVPGLREAERLTVPAAWLAALARRFPLAIVTGRPRADAERFLSRFGIRALFSAVVTRDDGPLKPDPFPVAAARDALGVRYAWMIGDTPDDMASARAAAVLPIGVLAPGDAPGAADALDRAGAARVLNTPQELDSCLP